jgi:hypothetical protein
VIEIINQGRPILMQISLDLDIGHQFDLGDQFDETDGEKRPEHRPYYADEGFGLGGCRRADEQAAQGKRDGSFLHMPMPCPRRITPQSRFSI